MDYRMKKVLIFAIFWACLSPGSGYHYPENEETPGVHRETDSLTVHEKRQIPAIPKPKPSDFCVSAKGTKVGGQCLFFEKELKDWKDSVKSCDSKGQQLVILTDPPGFNSFMKKYYAGQDFWLGGSDTAKEGHFVWIDGSPFVNFPWDNKNPDNKHGRQDCLSWGWKNSFDDEDCTKKFQYICELKETKPVPAYSWPYVGDGCCNLSTTPTCLKKGGDCIPRNDTCMGQVYIGSKYCDFNKLKSCKCCVPPNCATLDLCKALKGTCNTTCEGRSVSGKDFCKDSKHCKCCLPKEQQDCPCGQDYNGGCRGQYLPGKWATGHCEKNCGKGTYPLYNNTCTKTGGEDCKCCAPLKDVCSPKCINGECIAPNKCKCTKEWKGPICDTPPTTTPTTTTTSTSTSTSTTTTTTATTTTTTTEPTTTEPTTTTTSTTEPTTTTTEPTTTTTTTEPTTTTTTTEPTTTTTTEPTTTTTTEPTTTTTEPTTTTTKPTTTTTTTTEPTTTTTTNYCDILRTTICPNGGKCHEKASCIPNASGYTCKCNLGYAGDGYDCGEDKDIDTWPEVALTCCKVHSHCKADNCPEKPNSGQEDKDYDGIGDACDTVNNNYTGTTLPTTTPGTPQCQDLFDPSKTTDTDGDGHMDFYDNCPTISNVNQTDIDGDSVGDICDTDLDSDNDGIQDGIDNCMNVVNPEQSDTDKDGLGDKCDSDADNDGIQNTKDNCWLVPNPGQEDVNTDGVGDACSDDKDGDGCMDWDDICSNNPKVNSVNFGDFKSVTLDADKPTIGSHGPAVWTLTDGGKEITQEINSWAALMYGVHSFSGVDYDGTLFIANNWDNDNVGFVFGYQSNKKFYVVVWKKTWGLRLKKVNSITGPGETLASALNGAYSITNQTTLLWQDPLRAPWDYDTSYRWQLIHRPSIGLLRFRFLTGSTIIADSGNIFDEDIKGGRIGVYCQSQQNITWSGIDYSCNDDSVPQEVYDSLPADKKANLTVDPFKTWAGTVQMPTTKTPTIRTTPTTQTSTTFQRTTPTTTT